jgi:tRNA1(Val) A37 N6-methylase TrmN6
VPLYDSNHTYTQVTWSIFVRLSGRLKLGHFPLPPAEGEKIRNLLQFGTEPASVIDPCVGTGAALQQITKGGNCRLYGIELDAARAATAAAVGITTIQGSTFDTHSKVERFSLLYLNPPYDSEIGTMSNKRMEELFLEHTFRWLRIGGVLVFVIPFERLGTCVEILGNHFADVRPYMLADPESERFGQIVVFATRKHVNAGTIRSAKQRLNNYCNGYVDTPTLIGDELPYAVLPSPGASLTYTGLPLDTIEDLLPRSYAYQQVVQQFFLPAPTVSQGRPLTPLHAGHVGLLCTAGLLNGVFGEGENRHLARWRSTKDVQTTEEVEINEDTNESVLVRRHTERFSNDVTLLFEDGRTAILGEKPPLTDANEGADEAAA